VRISDVIGCRVSEERPIRKFPAQAMSFDLLERLGSEDPVVRWICRALVMARKSLLVAGGTGSSKTSLLNALSGEITGHERVVTIEDARELQIEQPNLVALGTMEPYADGPPPLTIGDLVRNSLRQPPDRIIVGEVRGRKRSTCCGPSRPATVAASGPSMRTTAKGPCMSSWRRWRRCRDSRRAWRRPWSPAPVDVVIHQHVDDEENVRRVAERLEMN
jgi:hypothetical protein